MSDEFKSVMFHFIIAIALIVFAISLMVAMLGNGGIKGMVFSFIILSIGMLSTH